MQTAFTVVFKRGNTIDTTEQSAYTAAEAIAAFTAAKERDFPYASEPVRLLAIMPTEVFALLPDASVFFGIFPY